jgi:hypothetical protein
MIQALLSCDSHSGHLLPCSRAGSQLDLEFCKDVLSYDDRE